MIVIDSVNLVIVYKCENKRKTTSKVFEQPKNEFKTL